MIISNTASTSAAHLNTSALNPNSFYNNNVSTNPFTHQALASTASHLHSSVVLCSREDQSRYLKDME